MDSRCKVCPHFCNLSEGEIGKCLVRQNVDGEIINQYYGQCASLVVDTLEKRPFFHFCPGEKFLSGGFLGCSLTCNFCQSHKISQSTSAKTTYKTPQELIDLAREKEVSGLCFTFNEPTVHYEYIREVCSLKGNLKICLKSNGFTTPEVIEELNGVDAWNIDIKGDNFEYMRVCGGELAPVLDAIKTIYDAGKHLEISYLILPRMLSDTTYHWRIREWLCALSPDIPLHLLYFYPFHEMTEEKYDKEDIIPIWELMAEKMENVYISNIFSLDFLKYRQVAVFAE